MCIYFRNVEKTRRIVFCAFVRFFYRVTGNGRYSYPLVNEERIEFLLTWNVLNAEFDYKRFVTAFPSSARATPPSGPCTRRNGQTRVDGGWRGRGRGVAVGACWNWKRNDTEEDRFPAHGSVDRAARTERLLLLLLLLPLLPAVSGELAMAAAPGLSSSRVGGNDVVTSRTFQLGGGGGGFLSRGRGWVGGKKKGEEIIADSHPLSPYRTRSVFSVRARVLISYPATTALISRQNEISPTTVVTR